MRASGARCCRAAGACCWCVLLLRAANAAVDEVDEAAARVAIRNRLF